MRLAFLRTANPDRAGGPWMIMDEDLPTPANYNPVFVGTAAQCGRYVEAQDHPVFRALSDEARHVVAREHALRG